MDTEKRNESVLTYNMCITVVRLGRSSERNQLKVQLTDKTRDVVVQSRFWIHVYNMDSVSLCCSQERLRNHPDWEMNHRDTDGSSA